MQCRGCRSRGAPSSVTRNSAGTNCSRLCEAEYNTRNKKKNSKNNCCRCRVPVNEQSCAADSAWCHLRHRTPAARNLLGIIELADGIMVARGDLGVEMPPENVPRTQKLIVREARRIGKPVIVATQMLESMITNATPTRAEASDVATAVYDGADAIMLSAESASGQYPIEAVLMMDRIARHTQEDPTYHTGLAAQHPDLQHTAADALTAAAHQVAETIEAAAIVTYTTSGSTTLRAVRERPDVPIMCLTSKLETARRLVLSFGVHAVHTADVNNFNEMVHKAVQIALRDGIAHVGQKVVITAGVPFGTPGNTNVLRLATIEDNADPRQLALPEE